MERLDLRAHLFERQLAVNVALIDGQRFIAGLKSFEADRSHGLPHLTLAFGPLLLGDLESERHTDVPFFIVAKAQMTPGSLRRGLGLHQLNADTIGIRQVDHPVPVAGEACPEWSRRVALVSGRPSGYPARPGRYDPATPCSLRNMNSTQSS